MREQSVQVANGSLPIHKISNCHTKYIAVSDVADSQITNASNSYIETVMVISLANQIIHSIHLSTHLLLGAILLVLGILIRSSSALAHPRRNLIEIAI